MDKVRKPNISVCYTSSSEPYSIYSCSSLRPIQAGVLQGSLLGSTIFNINDIPSVENGSNIAISVCADNINISVRSGSTYVFVVRKLNGALGLLEPWFQRWRIKSNTKNAQLHCFPSDCATIAAARVQ
jgi:hypothetical protein